MAAAVLTHSMIEIKEELRGIDINIHKYAQHNIEIQLHYGQ